MKVYIAGISGTGMGPLALFAKGAGYDVCGSDVNKGAIYGELERAGIRVYIGKQDGNDLARELKGLDWFVYTSALAEDNPELVAARKAGVKCTKRDDFTAYLVKELVLYMVAVAGTHGKTTTTSMIVWLAQQFELPAAHVVGTTLGFTSSGAYNEDDRFFIYEADEYDRNFLKYHPWTSVITNISYDHPDIYKDKRAYKAAFMQFMAQSEFVIDEHNAKEWSEDVEGLKLAGEVRRKDAIYAMMAASMMKLLSTGIPVEKRDLVSAINRFPGVGRRFERIAEGLYTDYAHHPEEIVATLEMAREQAEMDGRRGVVAVYQPHQNTRQHEVRDGYATAFDDASKVIWLPTYLTRENPDLAVLTSEELASGIDSKKVEFMEMSDGLEREIQKCLDEGYLVVMMTAGPADGWLREKFLE